VDPAGDASQVEAQEHHAGRTTPDQHRFRVSRANAAGAERCVSRRTEHVRLTVRRTGECEPRTRREDRPESEGWKAG
jgi:hypothetical protein